MLLRSRVKGTIDHVADSVLLGRNSNGDPDRYQANSIHDSSNNLGGGSLSHISDVAQNAANFKTSFSLIIIY